MNSILVSSIVFTCVFAAALAGMALRRALPEGHVSSDAKDVVRLGTGLIATMAALVLGMLVSDAKSSYDARKNEVAQLSSGVVLMDGLLAKYGPETGEIRAEFRQLVQAGIDRVWPSQASRQAELRPTDKGDILSDRLLALVPANAAQSSIKAQIIPMITELRQTQWLLYVKSEQQAIPIPLLVVLVVWLAAIYVSFGLFAPPNPTVVVTLALSALAVSSAILIILEMYTPFRGILRISPRPILDALSQMGH